MIKQRRLKKKLTERTSMGEIVSPLLGGEQRGSSFNFK